MITQYIHGFPKRDFIVERYIIAQDTNAKTRYEELIRLMMDLFNVRVLRDESGMFKGQLYIIGRRTSVNGFRYYLKQFILNIELSVENEGKDFEGYKNHMSAIKHGSTKKSEWRKELIKKVYQEVKTILSLKDEFYYDKYAAIRKVYENEMMDRTFFSEYIREARLTHLKPYSHAHRTPSTR